ncbi:MAG: 2,3-bisphosphoglycerate-independent phosphoglycerate mutase [Bacteroidetes bacterium OLB11]|nr:MAG: 2,3-bisphosphoglycerate-independent phosphoglycerate mutase [Bacteroidetes bacterium OLB11]
MSNKGFLIILDGWGHGRKKEADAIQHAHTPFVSGLYSQYPHSELITCGEDVGLPDGQMGNSEVGHLNIGAGRIVYQELQRINVAIRDGDFEKNNEFQKMYQYAELEKKTIHLVGLVSDGGVHSHLNHLKAICSMLSKNPNIKVLIHAFTDGRDTDPKSGIGYLNDLSNHIANTNAQIATITGRYYGMDRDKRWERVKKAYDALVNGIGEECEDFQSAIENRYQSGETDEFLTPLILLDKDKKRVGSIAENDVVFCFNFRTDRCREISMVLSQSDFDEFEMKKLPLYYVTMTEYDKSFNKVHVLFENDDLKNTIGEVIEKNHLRQIRIAETEKYPHVTFFFSGGRENPFEGEKRLLCASPRDVATYDLKPEMSARDITNAIIPELQNETADFICLNFANTDMVGHTGVWESVVKAAEVVDECVSKIIPIALEKGYIIFLTADHGNSDYMINEDGTPNTAHTKNPVPFFIISNEYKGGVANGRLADIAPTILHFMGIKIPQEMTGKILATD